MRPEQISKLAAIAEKLIDVFITEAEVEKWPGMKEAKERGDRYWHKKNALATLTLAARIQTVLREIQGGGDGGKDEPKPDEGETREKEAERLAQQGVALLETHRKKRGGAK